MLYFGAKQNLDKETGEVNGWSLPIVMNDRFDPTTQQVDCEQSLLYPPVIV